MKLEKPLECALQLCKAWDSLLDIFWSSSWISNFFKCVHRVYFNIETHFNKFFFKKCVFIFPFNIVRWFTWVICFELVICKRRIITDGRHTQSSILLGTWYLSNLSPGWKLRPGLYNRLGYTWIETPAPPSQKMFDPDGIPIFIFGLVSLFNGISTFVCYLMPKLFS